MLCWKPLFPSFQLLKLQDSGQLRIAVEKKQEVNLVIRSSKAKGPGDMAIK
jgi:hypothetical protein